MRAHLVLAMALVACDPQVDDDYAGETLAVLLGSVASPGVVWVAGIRISWRGREPRGPGEVRPRLPVRTSFPAGFEASVVAPPPVRARMRFDGEPAFAEGYLFALQWRSGELVPAGTDYR